MNRSQAIVEGGVEVTPSYLQSVLCAKVLACLEDMPSEETDFSHTHFVARHFSAKKKLVSKVNALTAHTVVAELQGVKGAYDTAPGGGPSAMSHAELVAERSAEAVAVASFKQSSGVEALHKSRSTFVERHGGEVDVRFDEDSSSGIVLHSTSTL